MGHVQRAINVAIVTLIVLILAIAVYFVKYPKAFARGFYRNYSLLASSRPLFAALSMEGLWALSMSISGTPNG